MDYLDLVSEIWLKSYEEILDEMEMKKWEIELEI